MLELRHAFDGQDVVVKNLMLRKANDCIEQLLGVAQTSGERGNLTKIAAECHRAKWEFGLSEDFQPSKSSARALIANAFNALHRIGDMALKLRDASPAQPAYEGDGEAAGALEPLSEEERLRKVLQNFADQMLTDEMELESSGDFEVAYDIMIKMARSALSSADRS
jgi:hypothetical protein